MPTDRPDLVPTTSVLTYLPALGYFLLRPQLLTRTPDVPWAGTS
jgi:hypothetical protein